MFLHWVLKWDRMDTSGTFTARKCEERSTVVHSIVAAAWRKAGNRLSVSPFDSTCTVTPAAVTAAISDALPYRTG